MVLSTGVGEAQAEEADRRAMRAARMAVRLHHFSAITVYAVAEQEDKPCLTMEYVPSRSLSTVLATQGPLPPEEIAKITDFGISRQSVRAQ